MHEGRRELAAEGERLAAEHLARAGYRIVARNVRSDGVEIDVIATRGEWVVFVEVKTRAGRRFGAPRRRWTHANARGSCAAPAPGSTPTPHAEPAPAST